jgi:hypothetical protein
MLLTTWIALCRACRDASLLVAQGLALDAGRDEGRLAAVVNSANTIPQMRIVGRINRCVSTGAWSAQKSFRRSVALCCLERLHFPGRVTGYSELTQQRIAPEKRDCQKLPFSEVSVVTDLSGLTDSRWGGRLLE